MQCFLLKLWLAVTGPQHTSEQSCCCMFLKGDLWYSAEREECTDKEILQHKEACWCQWWNTWFDLAYLLNLAPRQHCILYDHLLEHLFRLNITIHLDKHLFITKGVKCVWHLLSLGLTCGTEGNEGLDMFPYKCQLILGQRQPPHNVLNEVVRRYCCQVPLQLPQNY